MGRSELKKHLEKDLAGALEAHDRMRRDLSRRRGRPPEPGELYLFTFFDEARAEWAVVDRVAEDDAGLLVVAADLHPAVGSRDVVARTVDGGPLTLRCGVEMHLAVADLDQAMLVGLLPAEAVERARGKLESIRRGEVSGDENADTEGAYQGWMEELAQERAVLVEHLAHQRAPARTSDEGGN